MPEPLNYDDNGITGPDWGRSELVFDHVPVKTLAPQNGVSLCHIHCDLLVSSTLCFFVFGAFWLPIVLDYITQCVVVKTCMGEKFIFPAIFVLLSAEQFFLLLFPAFPAGQTRKDAVNIRDSTDIAQRFRALDNRSFALLL